MKIADGPPVYTLKPHHRIAELCGLPYTLGPPEFFVEFLAAHIIYEEKFAERLKADGRLSRAQRSRFKIARSILVQGDNVLRFLAAVDKLSKALRAWNKVSKDHEGFRTYTTLVDPAPLGAMTIALLADTLGPMSALVAEDHDRIQETLMANSYKRVSIPHGDSKQAAYEVECGCGALGHVTFKTSAGLPEEAIERKLKQRGWFVDPRSAKCPTCRGITPVSKPTPVVAADTPRVMSPADKRRVFREIDESWDENKGRYTGSITDKSIAEKLGVPRAWIELTRTEAFGAARNEDVDLLLGNLKNLQGEAKRMSEKCLEMAAGYEDFGKRVSDALRKVGEVA